MLITYPDRRSICKLNLCSNKIGFIDFNRVHACIIHDVPTMYDRAVSNFGSVYLTGRRNKLAWVTYHYFTFEYLKCVTMMSPYARAMCEKFIRVHFNVNAVYEMYR